MQANEFVKKFGWNDARVCILNCACPEDRWLMRHGEFISDDAFDDLKRLIESYELVEKVGGLSLSKDLYRDFECVHIGLDLIECRKLGKAIADVESCYEN